MFLKYGAPRVILLDCTLKVECYIFQVEFNLEKLQYVHFSANMRTLKHMEQCTFFNNLDIAHLKVRPGITSNQWACVVSWPCGELCGATAEVVTQVNLFLRGKIMRDASQMCLFGKDIFCKATAMSYLNRYIYMLCSELNIW